MRIQQLGSGIQSHFLQKCSGVFQINHNRTHFPAACHRSQNLWFLSKRPASVQQNKMKQCHSAQPYLCIVHRAREFFRRYTVPCVLLIELLPNKFQFLHCADAPEHLFLCTARMHRNVLRQSSQNPL